LVQTLTVRHQDQFVHTSALEQPANLVAPENSDQLESPDAMVLDGASERMCCGALPDDRNVSHVQRAMLVEFHQNDTIRNKKDVIDDQREEDDQAVRCIRFYKRDCSGHDQARKTYRLRQSPDLSERRKGRFRINTEH